MSGKKTPAVPDPFCFTSSASRVVSLTSLASYDASVDILLCLTACCRHFPILVETEPTIVELVKIHPTVAETEATCR
jgi:hypothetical protein